MCEWWSFLTPFLSLTPSSSHQVSSCLHISLRALSLNMATVWDGWEAAYWSMAHILLATLLERVSLCPTSRLLFLLPHSPLPMALVVRSSSPQWLPLIPEVPTELQRPTVAEAHSLPRISPWTIFQMVREFSDSQVAFPIYIMPKRGILKTISVLSKPSIYQMLPLIGDSSILIGLVIEQEVVRVNSLYLIRTS